MSGREAVVLSGGGALDRDFCAPATGRTRNQIGMAARAARQLESMAALRGWPVGELLGPEASLCDQLDLSREAFREAVRILESRGAMQMCRGRGGGLRLAEPETKRTAEVLGILFRASGITEAETAQSTRALDQLLARRLKHMPDPLLPPRMSEQHRHWMVRVCGNPIYELYAAILDGFTLELQSEPPGAPLNAVAWQRASEASRSPQMYGPSVHCRLPNMKSGGRASILAAKIVARGDRPNAPLGNESALCEEFSTSRSVIRQAVRILQDLDMIRVRLGRGGGYALKQPCSRGAIRHTFGWLAARHFCPYELMETMWDFDAVNLRLAGEALTRMHRAARDEHCDQLLEQLDRAEGPERLVRFRQSLSKIAACPLIDMLARCIASYQTRNAVAPANERAPDLLRDAIGIVESLRNNALESAENRLQSMQEKSGQELFSDFAFPVAAE